MEKIVLPLTVRCDAAKISPFGTFGVSTTDYANHQSKQPRYSIQNQVRPGTPNPPAGPTHGCFFFIEGWTTIARITAVQIWLALPQKLTNPLQKVGKVRYIGIDPQAHKLPATANKTVQFQGSGSAILLPFSE